MGRYTFEPQSGIRCSYVVLFTDQDTAEQWYPLLATRAQSGSRIDTKILLRMLAKTSGQVPSMQSRASVDVERCATVTFGVFQCRGEGRRSTSIPVTDSAPSFAAATDRIPLPLRHRERWNTPSALHRGFAGTIVLFRAYRYRMPYLVRR